MSRKREPKAANEPTIYVGPSINSWPLKQYTTFIGGVLPKNIAEKVDLNPDVGVFIIPPKMVSEVERKIADKTSAYAAQFAKISKLNKG